ncbi:BadF/BadG/BcrA/BcrD ATPase family protein [Paenibacillus sp. FSL P4-0338]|uniref:N-acetylglucosamine kinase n=1 Tax=unclassified Paenibacillus TaxID=185978 RepID=UPI0003E1BF12|nr:BadF/BadG/BcrA/BcrD ATPase family protein [Paenibacillus sp. FSL R7-269]ETT47972.1 BadF/BadG/BcrA/BcrD type ATPase [Paenibacillus sp. FSL R7-269]
MAFIVGMDGGGTKTAVIVTHDDQEEPVLSFTAGPINYNGGDAGAIAAAFGEIFNQIRSCCTSLAEVNHVCIGAAGVSNPAVARFLEQQVRDNGYSGPLTITGDQETALYGAQNAMQGIILIAGTGSICFGVNEKGERHRTGGFGHLIDDEGSGYYIGRELLSLLVQAEDGRTADTMIPALVYKQLGLGTVQEIIGFVYHKNTTKKDIAALAPVMTAACGLGDAQALKLAEQCAAGLFELVVPVIERLKLYESKVAIAGSVLQKSRFVREALERKLARSYPQTQLIMPVHNAAYGAVLLGKSKMSNG